jgi:hypothetical protein
MTWGRNRLEYIQGGPPGRQLSRDSICGRNQGDAGSEGAKGYQATVFLPGWISNPWRTFGSSSGVKHFRSLSFYVALVLAI